MTAMSLFKDNPLATSSMFETLMNLNKKLGGGSGAFGDRISVKGGKFRIIEGGEQVHVSREAGMNIVVLDSAPISRAYYEGEYDPDGPATGPTCWSNDTNKPASDVPSDDRQHSNCNDCPMNVKGSGQGESRACRYSQRVAVALEGKLDKPYILQLAATSLFGDGNGDDRPMQAYVRFLNGHNAPISAILTEMYFDDDSSVPKLFFRPVRPLEEDELTQVVELATGEKVAEMLELATPGSEGSKEVASEEPAEEPPAKKAPAKKATPTRRKPKPKPKPEPEPEAEPEDDGDDEIEEPVRKEKKPVLDDSDDEMEDMLDEWDDA